MSVCLARRKLTCSRASPGNECASGLRFRVPLRSNVRGNGVERRARVPVQ